MGSTSKFYYFPEKLIKSWSFIGIDAIGNSGGLIVGWRESINVLNTCVISLGLLLEFYSKGWNRAFKVFNAHGVYSDKWAYCDKFFHSNVILALNLIVGGDLNFTLNHKELECSTTRTSSYKLLHL